MLSETIIILITALISLIIGWVAKAYFSSNPRISQKEFEDLKTENIELRSEIANLKSPANDVETLKSIINIHISESEEKNKKIYEYESKIKDMESNISSDTINDKGLNILFVEDDERELNNKDNNLSTTN